MSRPNQSPNRVQVQRFRTPERVPLALRGIARLGLRLLLINASSVNNTAGRLLRALEALVAHGYEAGLDCRTFRDHAHATTRSTTQDNRVEVLIEVKGKKAVGSAVSLSSSQRAIQDDRRSLINNPVLHACLRGCSSLKMCRHGEMPT